MPSHCTWPRWPSSQDFAWGLLKQDNLCVYQACRTRSLVVQAATTATSPAATKERTSPKPGALRNREKTPCRRDMSTGRTRCAGNLQACPVRPAVALGVAASKQTGDRCCTNHFLRLWVTWFPTCWSDVATLSQLSATQPSSYAIWFLKFTPNDSQAQVLGLIVLLWINDPC